LKNVKFRKAIFVIVLILTLVSGLYNYHSFHMHEYTGFDGGKKGLNIYWCITNEDNFTEEVGRCVYPGYKKFLGYVKD